MNGRRLPDGARQAILVGIPLLSGCVGDFTSAIPAFPDEQSTSGLLWHCRDDAVICANDPEKDVDDSQGILTYSLCVHPDRVVDGEPPDRYSPVFFVPESCPETLLGSNDEVCIQVEDAACDLRWHTSVLRYDVAFEVQITYCDAFVCEAGEACSCPECAGNEFCWPTCEHSEGEGTRCDAPGGSPNLTGAWCCPLVYACTEEPPLACEPA